MKLSFSNLGKNPFFFALLAIFFWATAATAFKIALRYENYRSLLFYSVLSACFYLYLLLLISGKFKILFSATKKDYLHSVILGFFNPFLYYLILFNAYNLLPAHIAQPLNFIWPIVTVFFSVIFLKHRIRWFHVVALSISFIGVLIISTQGKFISSGSYSLVGIGLALSSSLVWASFFIFNVKDKRDETVKLALNFTFGLIFILLYSLFQPFHLSGWSGFLACAYVGFFEMALPFVFWLKALTLTDSAAKVSNLIFLTPFLSLLSIAIVLREEIHLSAIIGLLFIVSGIAFQRAYRGSNKTAKLHLTK